MDVLEAIRVRRSVRDYAARAIPGEVMDRMRQALRSAPSACNIQPWHFILVSDHGIRHQIAKAANDQLWMAEAPAHGGRVRFSRAGLPADGRIR